MNKEFVKKLAEDHWGFIEKIISPDILVTIEYIEMIYKEAMIHGYKHGYSDGIADSIEDDDDSDLDDWIEEGG